MSAHLHSSGRGGAGNIVDSARSPKLHAQDLETPTLKNSVVTTGRGGTGNMAKNTDPVETRKWQDVEPVTRSASIGATHIGRGGTGNVYDPKSEEAKAKHAEKEKHVEKHAEKHTEKHIEKEKEKEKESTPPASASASAAPVAPAHDVAAAAPPAQHKSHQEPGWAEKGKHLLFGKK